MSQEVKRSAAQAISEAAKARRILMTTSSFTSKVYLVVRMLWRLVKLLSPHILLFTLPVAKVAIFLHNPRQWQMNRGK
jgi:hypothetical protein